MHRSSAFTLVEVTIAITVTIILAGIAIPRYNDLIRTQDFYSQVQELVSCVQRAQSLAAGAQGSTLSNGAPIRWSAAAFSEIGGTVTCEVMAFDSTTSLASLAAASPVSLLTSGSNTFIATDTTAGLVLGTPRRIYFGTLERGVPVKDTAAVNPVPLGNGFSFTLPLSSTLDTAIAATLSMGQNGAPVEVVRQ